MSSEGVSKEGRHGNSDTAPVSVVIPTCDRPVFLMRALESVLGQSLKPCEILVVDDGRSKCDASALPRSSACEISVLVTEGRRGVSYARNLGAAAAKGTYIAFLDDDDRWHQDFVLHVFSALQSTSADFAGAGLFSVVGPHAVVQPSSMPPSVLRVEDWLRKNQGITGSNMIIRRDLFWKVGGFDEHFRCASEDTDLVVRLAQAKAVFCRIDKRLVYSEFTEGRERLTGLSRRRILSLIRFLKKHRSLMEETGVYHYRKADLYMKIVKYNFHMRGKRRFRYIYFAFRLDPGVLLASVAKKAKAMRGGGVAWYARRR